MKKSEMNYEKMGSSCYWNSISAILDRHGVGYASLAHLNFGCFYSGITMEESFILTFGNDPMDKWIYRFIQLHRRHFSLTNDAFNREIMSEPAVIAIDTYSLHFKNTLFPREHGLHYVAVMGMEHGDKVHVVDHYYGFKGMIEYHSLKQAFTSAILRREIGESIQMTLSQDEVKAKRLSILDLVVATYYERIMNYLNGEPDLRVRPRAHYYYGLEAVRRLLLEIGDIIEYFMHDHRQRRAMLSKLVKKFNNCFLNEREGILRYVLLYRDLLEGHVTSQLVELLEKSVHNMKLIPYLIIKHFTANKPSRDLIPTLKRTLKQLEETESRLHEHLYELVRRYVQVGGSNQGSKA